jgi:integrase
MSSTLEQRKPEETDDFMANKKRKRTWGTGSIVEEKLGLAIRWSETIIGKDGKNRRKWKYEFLGNVSRREAEDALIDRRSQSRRAGPYEERTVPTFEAHAARWERDVLPTYEKHSVRLGHGCILKKHLVPRFGKWLVSRIGGADIQEFIRDLQVRGYAPHSIHHFHEVMRVVMREAVGWYGLPKNPAVGVRLPKLKSVRKKWALTAKQVGALLGALRVKTRAMVGLAIMTGMRRGELLALRWGHVNEGLAEVKVLEAYYQGHLDTPKTDAGERTIGVESWLLGLIRDWRVHSKRTRPNDLVFGTRTGKVDNPNNILRRYVYPACDMLGIPRATWLTFRRTFSTLAHNLGVPAKTIAEIMGHADVDTQFVYIQGTDEAKKVAAERIAEELRGFCTDGRQMSLSYVN